MGFFHRLLELLGLTGQKVLSNVAEARQQDACARSARTLYLRS